MFGMSPVLQPTDLQTLQKCLQINPPYISANYSLFRAHRWGTGDGIPEWNAVFVQMKGKRQEGDFISVPTLCGRFKSQ